MLISILHHFMRKLENDVLTISVLCLICGRGKGRGFGGGGAVGAYEAWKCPNR